MPVPPPSEPDIKLKTQTPSHLHCLSIGFIKIANIQGLLPCPVQIKDLAHNNRRGLTIAPFYCPTFPILFSRVSGQKVVVGAPWPG